MMDDDDEDDDIPSMFSFFEFQLKLIRVLDDTLVPSTIKFKAEFIATASENSELDFAFRKIDFWLTNIADHSVVFGHDNEEAIAMFINEAEGKRRVGNVMMLTPTDPDDQHLAAVLQAKLQALSGQSIGWGPIEIASDNDMGFKFTFVGDSTAVLPKMKDWVGAHTYFDQPWWDRDDGSTLDILPPEDADLSVKPEWAISLDFLKEPEVPSALTGGKIVRPEFRPKVIDGGKKEE